MFQISSVWAIFLFVITTNNCLYADSVVVSETQDYDLSGVPPSATKLLRKERKENEAQTIESFKKIVQDLATKKKNRRSSGRKPSMKKNGTKMPSGKGINPLAMMMLQQKTVSQDLIDVVQKQLEDPELTEKFVSLHVKKMPTKDVIALLGKSTGVQFVVDSDITGTLQELRLDNIPLAAALASILTSNDPRLALIKDFGVWRIIKMQAAIDMFANMAARQREKEFSSSVLPIAYTTWNDAFKARIEKLWQGISRNNPDPNNNYIVFDDVNKKIFFKSRKAHVEEFIQYLKEIDIKIPQIRIDARVVLANKDFEESLGFNWSGVYNRRASVKHTDFVGLGPINKKTGDGTDKATTPFNDIVGWALNLVPSTITPNAKIPFVFGNSDLNTKRLNLELNIAENKNEARTILKPSLLVYNEELAEILVGESFPHEVRLDETIESRLTNVTTVNYKDVGMKIRVKPIVTPDHQSVFLDVFVENSVVSTPDFNRQETSVVGGATTTTGFNYTVKTSRSHNRVLLKSGQTTLIGGLITATKRNEEKGIPLLMDIPLFGWLFKNSYKKLVDEQLLIFITPTLIDT